SGAAPPYQIGLDLMPAALAAGSEMPGYVVVELLGSKGVPLAAPQDVVVTLTSSQPGVATTDSRVVIPQGEYFAVAEVRAGGKGDSTIAAQADGFQAASKQLKVAPAGAFPSKLVMYAIPTVGLTGHRRPYAILVQAVDALDAPTAYPCTDTNLAVSDRSIGTFTTPFTIPEGYVCGATAAYGTATLEPGPSGVSGAVFASANGVSTATLQVRSLGATPQRAVASFAFPSTVHGDTPYNFLVVQFQDLAGVPARATSDLQVFLRGSELRLPTEVSAPAGASEVTVPAMVGSAGATGTALVVVRGMPDTQATVNIVKVSVDVKLEARPTTLLLGQETRVQARVTFNEQPVSGVPIQWSTQGGEILSATQVTGDDGIATLVFRPTDLNPAQVTAQAIRFGTAAGAASVTLQALPATSARRPAPSISFLGVRIPVLWLTVLVGLVLVVYLFVSYGWAGRLARALGGRQTTSPQAPTSPPTPRASLGDVLRSLGQSIASLLRRGR
ncbi:MAG: Ig-like domain-containing protein, partial [Chloroflexota bacterium]|nr:Ig-like domain-containing protein [Chloroflexota bacterium]